MTYPQQAKPVRTGEGFEKVDLLYNFVKFRTSILQYSVSGIYIDVLRWCNAIALKNAGNTVCTVDGDIMQPGETKSIGGNAFEIYDEKHLLIQFSNPGGVVNPVQLLIVTQKFYVGISSASSV